MKKLLVAAFALSALCANATIENLLPTPQQVTTADGTYTLPSTIAVNDPTDCFVLRNFLLENNVTISADAATAITVEIVDEIPGSYDYELAEYENEAYTLAVTTDGIKIQAVTPTGVIRAAQTLAQLAQDSNGAIECVNITDWAAFKLRGFMHDVGRSFISVEELKRQIDLLSRFKVNTFHWHLTDETGWRLEIKEYPQLTGEKGITRFPGKFYTQEDAKEIQDYAAERGMTVVPEIDMPGHSTPFVNAMGFNMQSSQGIAALKVILSEVCALFDTAPYIHIGGDEQSYNDSYIIDMINYVHGLGKKVVIWNRYNYPAKLVDPNTIPCDMVFNWATSGTLVSGLPNVDMRYNYINHFDVFADLVGIYKSNIFYVEKGNPDVAGTITGIWNDTMVPSEGDIVRQNNFYANILASAERAWIGGGEQYIETGGTHLPNSGSEFESFADWERRFLHHKNTTLASTRDLIPYVKQTNVSWYLTDQIPNGGSNTKTLAPENYLEAGAADMPTDFEIDGVTYHVKKITGAGHYLRHIWHGTVKGVYDNPQTGVTSYAWTYIYSPIEQDAAAFIEFYTYSRSGAEKMPLKNKWDRRGSRIWLNGTEIEAPEWTQPNKDVPQNSPTEGLTNENFTARPATPIHLNAGWNKVFMKLPYVDNGGTKRNKWQFTFVVTDTDGRDALEGLIYSPTASIDKEAEMLSDLILEARNAVKAKINDLPGYYASTELDVNLLAKTDEIEATLGSEMSAEERAAQKAELQQLLNAFLDGYAAAGINQPKAGVYYYMCTPMRGNRYPTDVNGGLYGSTTATEASAWTFVSRGDGTYDIVNYSTKNYVNTNAAYNSQLKTGSDAPATGWELKPAATDGHVIIVNGSAQFNQTNNDTLGYNVFNWGSGTDTADTGCQYLFSVAEYGEEPDPGVPDTESPTPVVILTENMMGTDMPYMLTDTEADKVFALESFSVAIDVTMGGSINGRGVFVGAADPAAEVATTGTPTATPYFAFGYNGQKLSHLASSKQGDMFTAKNTTLAANTNVKVVYVVNRTDAGSGTIDFYADGTPDQQQNTYPLIGYELPAFCDIKNNHPAANIYVGGNVANNSAMELCNGTIHSVQFFNEALSAEQVAAINYTDLPSSGINEVEAPATAEGIYDLQGRKLNKVNRPGLYVINGKKSLVK